MTQISAVAVMSHLTSAFLTHYRTHLRVLRIVVWIYDTYDNNSGIKNTFTKYLKGSRWWDSD